MLTWTEARAKVRGDLWRTGTQGIPDDVCDRALHASLLDLESQRRFLWLEDVILTVAMAAADDKLAQQGISSISSIAYLSSPSGYDVLDLVPLQIVRTKARGSAPGAPSCYAFSNGTVYFDTQVPIGGQFELVAHVRTPKDLDAAVAAASNETLAREQQAVLSRACFYVAGTYLKDSENAARHEGAWERHLLRILDEEDEARGSVNGGLIVPDTAYRDAAFGR